MPNPKFRNFMVWRKSQQKKLWTNWICFDLDLGKWTNLDGGIKKESQQMQVRSLPQWSSKINAKLAEFV